jgi:ABC-2 type transport system ATP-binding protein
VDTVIEVDRLTKAFGRTKALDGLRLSVETGHVHGFLGPNGAGKSTALRILLGLMRADSGSVQLLGGDPWKDAVRLHRRIAYVPGDVMLWPGLTGGQCIDVLAGAGVGLDDRRRTQLIERFGLDPTKRISEYSKGNRQKVALVAALASHAELLLFDEPTSGLDPLMEEVFQQSVRERVDDGVSVLLSTHVLAEAEALSDRVTIISQGRTIRTGGLEELRRGSRTKVHAVTASDPVALTGHPAVTNVEVSSVAVGAGFDVRFDVEESSVEESLTVLFGSELRSLTVRPPNLDELFLDAYAGTAAL